MDGDGMYQGEDHIGFNMIPPWKHEISWEIKTLRYKGLQVITMGFRPPFKSAWLSQIPFWIRWWMKDITWYNITVCFIGLDMVRFQLLLMHSEKSCRPNTKGSSSRRWSESPLQAGLGAVKTGLLKRSMCFCLQMEMEKIEDFTCIWYTVYIYI